MTQINQLSVKDLTAKDVMLAIKKGLTPEDLTKKYNCNEEELKKRLIQLYRHGKGKAGQDRFAELVANRKKSHSKKTNDVTVQPEETGVQSAEPTTLPVTATQVATVPDTLEPAMVAWTKWPLEDLIKQADSFSETLIQLESEHKALAQRRLATKGLLRELVKKIEEVESLLRGYQEEYEQKLAEANADAEEMNKLCVPIHEKREALESIRRLIEERQKVTLFVYSDGRIEAPDNPDFFINDDGYQELKVKLHDRKECLDLRLRDIDTLARLLTVTEGGIAVNLICENEELERVYHVISQA